jgi:DHA1 family bicyclomycin/chloramphenicol resistance-like MFS transporter
MHPPPNTFLLFMLVAVTAIGPMAMQIFLPALPAIRDDFGVSAGTAQLAFSLSTFSIAVAMLAYGPLSDRYGRRPVLVAGLAIYLAGTAACLIASGIGTLILGRIVQAAGGCAGMVLARAMVQDLYGRERSATVLAYLTMAMVVAPMVAPAIGGFLTDGFGWRANFTFGTVLGIALVIGTVRAVHETHPHVGSAVRIGDMVRSFSRLFRNRAFGGYAFQCAFSISLFFSFLAGAPFITIEVMGRPATEYGLWFITISAAFMLGNFVAARTSVQIGMDRMIIGGASLALAGVLVALVLAFASVWTPAALFLPTALTAFAQGLSIPNAQAGAISSAPDIAGAASGLSGFLQMGLAAVFAQVVGLIQDGTPYPTLFAMLLCGVCSLGTILYATQGPDRRLAPARH